MKSARTPSLEARMLPGVYSTGGNPKRQKCRFESSGTIPLGPAVLNISLDVSSSRPMRHGSTEKYQTSTAGFGGNPEIFPNKARARLRARGPEAPRPDAPRHGALVRIRRGGLR